MIWVFLPAYNEEKALPVVARKFRDVFARTGQDYRIVVLDDGSSDRTADVALELSRQLPLTLIRHAKNMGLGPTMDDGLDHLARESADDDVIVTLDCDDTHEPSYTPDAIKRLAEGADVVILSRYSEGGGEEGLSPLKSLLSRGAGLFLKVFFPIRGVREYSCGYRVMTAAILKKAKRRFGARFVHLKDLGFVATPEILIKFKMIGARIAEVPFRLRYDQKPTPSKNRPLRTIYGYFVLVALFWGRRAPADPAERAR
ncbi:MAG: Undecaprenyl-phosphate 4-deoxy-4-formamido-L-arabinose transferase [Candidatus Omnitrophica bacterium]|nr:Undecaprenyl-phosphate 4-deoxy-4-formamido-L-arabinose transferase [Candidatus Omnitrophota bacterium]